MQTPPALDDFEWSEADYWLLRSLPECMKAPRTSGNSPAGNEIDFDNRARLHGSNMEVTGCANHHTRGMQN